MMRAMTTSLDDLSRACTAVVAEARAHIAAGRDPGGDALEARIRAAAARARKRAPDEEAAIGRAERRALEQLSRLVAVHRARSRVAEPAQKHAAPAPAQTLRSALRTKPTISANMDVRRNGSGDTLTLRWDTVAAVTEWEVRISERPDARGDYEPRETRTLAARETVVEVGLGDRPTRVNILGRGRNGRLVRRALISGLTRDGWRDRWQQRASAS